MAYRWMALLTLAAFATETAFALAQGTFPAPLSSAGAASSVPSPCTNDYIPLREDTEKKGQLIREASSRHAPPEEACKLIRDYSLAEARMIKYVEANANECRISAGVADQLKAGHKNTERLQEKVCSMAEQQARRPGGPVGDFPDVPGRF
jgi:hypothetical protein